MTEAPSTVYRPDRPFQATLIESRGLIGLGGQGRVNHLLLDIAGSGIALEEGQSLGVLPPGRDGEGRPHKLRLYSAASTRLGDRLDGQTASLCVRHLTYEVDGVAREGLCSSYLCSLQPGEALNLTGPVGRALILPEDPLADLILIATGTGIAPFRAHLRRLFHPVERELRLSPAFLGRVSLFFGTTSRANLLYCEEIEALQGQSGGQLDLSCALSREERAPDGGRMYVQHRLEERGEELVARLRSPHARVYLCGLRGMEKGVEEALGRAGGAEVVARLKAERRWRVEVY